MHLQPLRQNARRQQTATVVELPPPVNGWNSRDDVTSMKPGDAIVLDNCIPGDGGVSWRNGYSVHATGLPAVAQTLMEYRGASGTPKLFAATSAAIYDVSSAGAVGAAAVSSLSNGQWQHTMFATSGGQFLVGVNGADGVRTYNGSTWASQVLTGVTAANLVNVAAHGERLWFCETDSSKAWYLPSASVAGAATSLELGGLSRYGGKLMAIGSWTRDGGSGMEDLAVFIMSTGETHIYAGTDPSSSSTWSRVGTFKLPEPIGRRCILKVGGDLGILSSQGLVPLSGVLNRAETAQARTAITDRIRPTFSTAYNGYGTENDWQVIEYPSGKLLIINVPGAPENVQFVMNANTGRWCRFTGLDASSWCLKGDDLFFSLQDGSVCQYTGDTDNGSPINGKIVHAFTNFGTVKTKSFRRILPRYMATPGYRPAVGFRFDYIDDEQMTQASVGDAEGTAWDAGAWDETAWAGGISANKRWIAISGEATTAAVVIEGALEEPFTYTGAKIEFEIGDHL